MTDQNNSQQPDQQQPMPQPPDPQQQWQAQPPGYQQPMAQPIPQQPVDGRHHVHHTYIWLGSIQVVFALLVAFVIALLPVFLSDEPLFSFNGQAAGSAMLVGVGLIVLFVVVVGLSVAVQVLSYKHLTFEIDDREFSLYSGIFNKKRVHVPYQRVQSVNQRASLIQRIFGVCTVHIDTAGGSTNKAVVVPYLQNFEAERLRAELFARKQMVLAEQAAVAQGQSPQAAAAAAYRQSMQGSNVLDAPAEIISDVRGVFGGAQYDTGAVSYVFGLSNKELVFTGLSNNTGFAIMIIAIVGSAFGLITQVLDTGIGKQLYNEGIAIATRTFADNLIWIIVGSLVVSMLVIWLLSIIGTCISYGGFRAVRRQNRIEVEHGLLQHRFHGVDIDRVQSVIIKQSFIRRLIGYCELSLGKIDAMSENSQDQEKSISHQGLVVHPFVKMSKVPEVLAGLVPEFSDVPTESKKLPPIALRRALIRRCILYGNGFWLAITAVLVQVFANVVAPAYHINLGGALFYINAICFGAYGLCVIIAIIEGVNAVMWFKGSSFAYNSRFMQISNGGFSRESVSFPRKKIQFGYTKTNPLQRSSHVATINVRTAAGVGGTTMRLLDTYEEDAEIWLDWVRPGQGVVK